MVPKSILDLNGLLEFHVYGSEEENSNVQKITDVLNVNIQSFFTCHRLLRDSTDGSFLELL